MNGYYFFAERQLYDYQEIILVLRKTFKPSIYNQMTYKDPIYGEFQIEGILEEIIDTNLFQRLKKIHHNGAYYLVNPKAKHSRFEHSVGVMLLIRKLNGNLEEQIAGLVHDISHTAFSHLIDYVLDNKEEDYHEQLFNDFILSDELQSIFKKYNLDAQQFLDLDPFHILEAPLPQLCADRLDYTLRDLFHFGEIMKSEIDWFLEGLSVFQNQIVVSDIERGIWIKDKYTILVQEHFNHKKNQLVNLQLKSILKELMEKQIIDLGDFNLDDLHLTEKIEEYHQKPLKEIISTVQLSDTTLHTKHREIAPPILQSGKVLALSELLK